MYIEMSGKPGDKARKNLPNQTRKTKLFHGLLSLLKAPIWQLVQGWGVTNIYSELKGDGLYAQ